MPGSGGDPNTDQLIANFPSVMSSEAETFLLSNQNIRDSSTTLGMTGG